MEEGQFIQAGLWGEVGGKTELGRISKFLLWKMRGNMHGSSGRGSGKVRERESGGDFSRKKKHF